MIVRRVIKRHGGSVWAEAEVDNGRNRLFAPPESFRQINQEPRNDYALEDVFEHYVDTLGVWGSNQRASLTGAEREAIGRY